MQTCMSETISGFNGYIAKIRQDLPGTARFSMAQFDSIAFEEMYNESPLGSVRNLTIETYQPRANTPLYDAIGKMIRANQHLSGQYKVLFVTLTDGEENASSEWTQEKVRALIKEMEDNHHWTFAHIGVGIDGWKSMSQLAMGTQSFSNVLRTSHRNAKSDYGAMAAMTKSYAHNTSAGGQSVQSVWSGYTPPTSPDDDDAVSKLKSKLKARRH